MALIKCPECGKEVSDKAPACIHCGCPLERKVMIDFNGKTYDITFVEDPNINALRKPLMVKNLLGCDGMTAIDIVIKYCPEDQRKSATHPLKCPKCGSTAITTGARGANWAWGFIGARQTVNRCGNCGYTWKPKK